MNRLFLVRHGGSTGNEDPGFYAFNDSAICLTTNGIRQALSTAEVIAEKSPRWRKPGDFEVEVFASEYTRAQQTARIVLDQMDLLYLQPKINPLLNERDYGTKYAKIMDEDPAFDGNNSESAIRAKARVAGFLQGIDSLLYRADVLAFSHFGAIRGLLAILRGLTDTEMMKADVPNGGAFLFSREFDKTGKAAVVEQTLPAHVLPKSAERAKVPAKLEARAEVGRVRYLDAMRDRRE